MVNKSTNINTNNTPSHNKLSITKQTQVLSLDRHKIVAGLNLLMGIQPINIDHKYPLHLFLFVKDPIRNKLKRSQLKVSLHGLSLVDSYQPLIKWYEYFNK